MTKHSPETAVHGSVTDTITISQAVTTINPAAFANSKIQSELAKAATVKIPDSYIEPTPEANITALLRLAGKTDLMTTSDLQAALMADSNLVRQAIDLLTCTTDDPAHYSFHQLISQSTIDAFRDEDDHPLPGAMPKVCGFQTHLVEIPYDDPDCTPDARHVFVREMLIPRARERVTEVLSGVFPPNIYAQLGHAHCALLSELNHRLAGTKLSHYVCNAAPVPDLSIPASIGTIPFVGAFNGSPCFVGEIPSGPIAPPYHI